MLSFTKLASLLLVAMTAVGCSKSNNQSVTINFPDWNQLQKSNYDHQSRYSSPTAGAGVEQAHIISINANGKLVTGFPWEAKKNGAQAPTSATFEAEIGSLVQAMAILETQDGARAYYYGDAKVVGSGTLDLYLSNVLTMTAGEGKVIGRYITGSDANGNIIGPTGGFQYRLDPSAFGLSGRPTMVVTNGEAFNGWVSVTTLPSNALIYTKPDGSPMFQLTTSDNALLSASAPQRAARIEIPKGFRDEDSGSNFDMRSSQHKDLVVGYFGPGADAYASGHPLNLCFPNVSDWTSALAASNEVPRLYRDAGATPTDTPAMIFHWSGSVTVPAPYADRTAHVWAGGLGSGGAGTCPVGIQFTNKLMVDVQNLSSEDEFLGIRGPFSKSGTDFTTSSYDSNSHKISFQWYPLPGVTDVIGGWSVYSRVTANPGDDDDIKVMDGYDCASMHARSTGFADFVEQQIPVALSNGEIQNVSISDSTKTQVIICPRAKDGTMFSSAIALRGNSGGGGGGGGGVNVTKIQVRSSDGEYPSTSSRKTHTYSLCYPITIEAADGTGAVGYMASSANLTVSSNNPNIAFYSQDTCQSGGQSTYTVSSFNGNSRVYVMYSGPSTIDYDITAHADNGFTDAVYGGHNDQALGYSGTPYLKTVMPSTIYAHSCTLVDLSLQDSTNQTYISGALAPVTAPLQANANFHYYAANDWNCSQEIFTPASITSGTFKKNGTSYRFIYTGAAATNVNITPVGPSNAIAIPASFNAISPDPVSLVQPIAPSQIEVNSCNLITAQLQDSNHRPSPNLNGPDVSVTLSTNSGSFYDDPNCQNNAAISKIVAIPNGQTRDVGTVYFKQSAITVVTLTATASPLTVGTFNPNIIAQNNMFLAQTVYLSGPGRMFDSSIPASIYAGTNTPALYTPPIAPGVYKQFSMWVLMGNGQAANGAHPFSEPITAHILTSGVKFFNNTQTDTIYFSDGVAYVDLSFDFWLDTQNVPVQIQLDPPASAPGITQAVVSTVVPVRALAPAVLHAYGSLNAATTACQPMMFVYEDVSGVPRVTTDAIYTNYRINNSGQTSVGGSFSGPSGDYNCSNSQPVTSVLESAGNTYGLFYYRFGAPQAGGRIDFNNDLYSPVSLTPIMVASSGGAPLSANQYRIYGPANPKVGVCTPYLLTEEDSNGISATNGSDKATTILAAGAAGGSVYDTADCSGSADPNFPLHDVKRSFVFFYKAANPGYVELQVSANSPLSGFNLPLTATP